MAPPGVAPELTYELLQQQQKNNLIVWQEQQNSPLDHGPPAQQQQQHIHMRPNPKIPPIAPPTAAPVLTQYV